MARADTLSQRINAERLVLLGWPRAILLQVAHPLIAEAVATHSTFRDGPLAAARRLRHTVGAMLDLTFGDESAYAQAIAGIRAIHDRVHGRLREAAGPFPAGTPYTAHDPALLLWVHATLLESIVISHNTFVRPLRAAERDIYCDEAAPVAIALGARENDVPRRWSALRDYIASVEASGAIVVTNNARQIAEAVLSPGLAPLIWPAARLNRLFTAATLPDDVRQQYGFEWSDARAARMARVAAVVRQARRFVPDRLAAWSTRVRRRA